ncbi:MAG: hypothetical protein KIS68_00185 [Bauldia sp.]|nr:hypothetical protein [Bauldia sp.]
MASDLKFAEDGLKLQHSIATKMEELLAAGGTVAIAAPTVGTVIGAAIVVIGLIKQLGDDDREVVDALKTLQKQVDEIKFVLGVLDGRLDELVLQVAIESNRQTLRDLLDYLDEFRGYQTELHDRRGNLDVAVTAANKAGIAVDKFLRNDFEIWRWTDVVERRVTDPATGIVRIDPALALMRFKNVPTLPVYLVGLATWLGAREQAIKLGGRSRLSGDDARVAAHQAATSIRINFDKYGMGDLATAQSIAEHIKSRIRAYVVASTPYPRNRICEFYFETGSLMTGSSRSGSGFELVMQPGTDTCFIDPGMLGSPNEELELETAAGLDTLQAMSELLGRVASGGSLAEPFQGVFSNVEAFPPGIFYLIDQAADLQWYRNEAAAARGGSTSWEGPKKVGNGWGGFSSVFNGGGAFIYAVKPDGDLLWYAHDGYLDGRPVWRGPNTVGNGWAGFRHVFSTGEYVVYGVQPDGRLMWYRHDDATTGGDASTWAGAKEVATGWNAFDKVFAAGDGVLYGIRPDGVLERRIHKGYLAGTADWEAPKEIGTGWGGFRDVVATGNGVLYAFTRDGRILWYRYAKKRPPAPPEPANPILAGVVERGRFSDLMVEGRGAIDQGPGIGGIVLERPNLDVIVERPGNGGVVRPYDPQRDIDVFGADVERWEGPVEIRRGVPAFRSAFAVMPIPYRGPN